MDGDIDSAGFALGMDWGRDVGVGGLYIWLKYSVPTDGNAWSVMGRGGGIRIHIYG